ncbi:MAG: hypothetical protein II534_02730 [Clostridia bacterium]|nr:hypothetical protein [Clostridia bacterium]
MKNAFLKKLPAALLALIMVAALFASCSEGPAVSGETTPAESGPAADTPAAETTAAIPENERDTLGDRKFDGGEYVILSRTLTSYEFIGDDTTGDLVKTAVAKRNLETEERLGVKLKVVESPGNWGDRAAFLAEVEKAYKNGAKVYDLVMTHSAYIVNIGLSGYAYNIKNLSAVDLNKKWWCPQYTENVDIDGKIFSAVGDIGYSLYEYTMCTYFNKDLASSNNIPDVYGLVDSNEWTYDRMLEIALGVGEDINGNGKADRGDLFGMSMSGHNARMCATVWDCGITEKDADGKHFITINNEKYINAYEKLYNSVYGNPNHVLLVSEGADMTKDFVDDHLLFFTEKLNCAASMREMKADYGIVPFPKYDAEQERYISSARDAMSALAVMGNIADPEMVGCVTEALGMYGWKYITPDYYETTLKYKYMSDPTASRMLDLIRDSLRFDFAMNFTNSIGLIYSVMGDNLLNGVKTVSGAVKASSKSWQRNVDEIYEAYARIG